MKRSIKSLLSVFIIFSMLVFISMYYPASAVSQLADPINKLDSVLKEKLAVMSDGDTVDVSVWVTDINQSTVKEQTQTILQDSAEDNQISPDTIVLLDREAVDASLHLNAQDADSAAALYSFTKDRFAPVLQAEKQTIDVSSEDVQFFVETQREVSAGLYEQKNTEIFNKLFPAKKQNFLRTVEQKQPKIIYSCTYAPNIMMSLTKNQIYAIIGIEEVEEINYYSRTMDEPAQQETEGANHLPAAAQADPRAYENLSTVWQDVTGITTLRDTLGLDGTGVRIGMLEHGAPNFSNTAGVNCFTHMITDINDPYSNKIRNVMDLGDGSSHSTYVASLMVGKLGAYKGVAPNAELYCAGVKDANTTEIYSKEGMEALLREDVNVINASHYFTGGNPNIYHDTAKWLDHIANNHYVSIVISSGNYGSYGVTGGNMAYNAIVVGDLDTKNTMTLSDDALWMTYQNDGSEKMLYCSSYSKNEASAYKPDLVAPGQYTACPYSTGGGGGTSSSAPVVTGAVAQLMQAQPLLMTRPDLVKALLLCGTEHMQTKSQENSDAPAMDRKLGSGMLNVYNSYKALSTSSYPKYYTGSYRYEDTRQIQKVMLVNKPCDTVRVALTWEKVSSFGSISDHLNDAYLSAPGLSNLKLTVTGPDGKVYTSFSLTGNVQVVAFTPSQLGTYHITIDRYGPIEHTTNFSLTAMNGDVMS